MAMGYPIADINCAIIRVPACVPLDMVCGWMGWSSGKGQDRYTFDFEYRGKQGKKSKVWLDHKSTGEIHIHGVVYGGPGE